MDRLFQYVGGKESHNVNAVTGFCFPNATIRFDSPSCRLCTLQELNMTLFIYYSSGEIPSLDTINRGAQSQCWAGCTCLDLPLIIIIWPLLLEVFCFSVFIIAIYGIQYTSFFLSLTECGFVILGYGWDPDQCGCHCAWSHNCSCFNVFKGNFVNVPNLNIMIF